MPEQPDAHPAFPEPEPCVSLRRYMDAGKFEWLVEHGRLFMPTAEHLGDPLEGTAPEGELRWWQRAAATAESDES